MSRRRDRGVETDPRPVAEMPENLQIYDAADWIAPNVTEPVGGHDDAAWQVLEEAHRRAYSRWQDAGRRWHKQFRLPPLRLVPDEPFTPPPNKVDTRDLPRR